jgi:hypothetical protein
MSDLQTLTTNPQATDLLHVESLIASHQAKLETLKKESRETREMIKDMLEGNPEYVALAKEAKTHIGNRNAKKKEILSQSEAVHLNEKNKDYTSQMKELRDALSDYLKTYQQISGSNLLETPDGKLQEIVYTARLVIKKESGQR